MAVLHFIPAIANSEGHPIELYGILDPTVQGWISGEQEFEYHRALLAMERRANGHLAHLTQKYYIHFQDRSPTVLHVVSHFNKSIRP